MKSLLTFKYERDVLNAGTMGSDFKECYTISKLSLNTNRKFGLNKLT